MLNYYSIASEGSLPLKPYLGACIDGSIPLIGDPESLYGILSFPTSMRVRHVVSSFLDHGETIPSVSPPAKVKGIHTRLEKGEQVLPLQAQAGIDATKYRTVDSDIARASQR